MGQALRHQLDVEVGQPFFDGGDRCVDVKASSAIVDRVEQLLLGHAGELTELVGTGHGDGFRQIFAADVLVQAPDAVTVDAERVHRHDGSETAENVIGVDLAALLHDADEHAHGAGVAFAHGDDHILDGHVGGDAFVCHL